LAPGRAGAAIAQGRTVCEREAGVCHVRPGCADREADMGERMSQHKDEWQRRATAAAIAAARKVANGVAINKNAPVSRLSDLEWGWIVSAILFSWISTHAEQATAEGLDTEQTVRLTGLDPNPWDAGAVRTILPSLCEEAQIDWTIPLKDWSTETMTTFLVTALGLIRKATIARDLGSGVTRRSSPDVIARQTNAAGGPLPTSDELNDSIPF
jgi:hypothetical protein